MNRRPWTREELDTLIPKLETELAAIEAGQEEEIRPLMPMTADEARDYFHRLMDVANQRPLTLNECFLHGQILCVFEMAIRADTLGKKGRFYVVHEEALRQHFNGGAK